MPRAKKPCDAETEEINPDNGKCRKKCKDGQFRNPDTNRCKKIPVPKPVKVPTAKAPNAKPARVKKEPKPCANDQERNEATGRCRKKCADGQIRSATGRCVKDKNPQRQPSPPPRSPAPGPQFDDEEEKEEDEYFEPSLMSGPMPEPMPDPLPDSIPVLDEIQPAIEIKDDVPKIPEKMFDDATGRKLGLPIEISTKQLQRHQIDFAKGFIEGKERGAVAIHGVGSGKTLTGVICAEMFLQLNPSAKVIVITPASLLAGFKAELYTYDPAIENDKRYEFYTYDGWAIAYSKKESPGCAGNMLIIDEGQNLRTNVKIKIAPDGSEEIKAGAKVLSILRGCALDAKKVLILTATPIVNNVYDIENLMAMINGHTPLSEKEFFKIWNDPVALKQYFGCRLSFFEHAPEMRMKYFPTVAFSYKAIVMEPFVKDEYLKIERDASISDKSQKSKWAEDSDSLGAFYNGVRRASNALGGDESPKVNFIIKYISDVMDDNYASEVIGPMAEEIIKSHTKKFVIFTHFLDAGSNLIKARFKRAGISFASIDGKVSKKKRAEIVDDYVAGKITALLISEAGAEGLNLLETGYVIIMEPSWNQAEQEQVIGRGVRFLSHDKLPENKRNVLVVMLFLIKPEELGEFNDLNPAGFDSKKVQYTDSGSQSVDLKLYGYSVRKQEGIINALQKLKQIESVEQCYANDLMDVSNLNPPIIEGVSAGQPDLPWEQLFYDEIIKNDNTTGWRIESASMAYMDDLKQRMVKSVRSSLDKEEIKKTNAFFTPAPIAKAMIRFSGINTSPNKIKFLEPSAGAGYLMWDALLNPNVYCDWCETNTNFNDILDTFPRTNKAGSDFLKLPSDKKYRVIIMNPPFNLTSMVEVPHPISPRLPPRKKIVRTSDAHFFNKAFEEHTMDDAIVVALVSSAFEFRKEEEYVRMREILESNEHFIAKVKGFDKSDVPMPEMATSVDMRLIKIYKKSDSIGGKFAPTVYDDYTSIPEPPPRTKAEVMAQTVVDDVVEKLVKSASDAVSAMFEKSIKTATASPPMPSPPTPSPPIPSLPMQQPATSSIPIQKPIVRRKKATPAIMKPATTPDGRLILPTDIRRELPNTIPNRVPYISRFADTLKTLSGYTYPMPGEWKEIEPLWPYTDKEIDEAIYKDNLVMTDEEKAMMKKDGEMLTYYHPDIKTIRQWRRLNETRFTPESYEKFLKAEAEHKQYMKQQADNFAARENRYNDWINKQEEIYEGIPPSKLLSVNQFFNYVEKNGVDPPFVSPS